MTTKDDVRKAFKLGKGNDIAKALREYFAQGIVEGRVKPLEFYKPNTEIQSGKNDIVEMAEQIFASS